MSLKKKVKSILVNYCIGIHLIIIDNNFINVIRFCREWMREGWTTSCAGGMDRYKGNTSLFQEIQ